jgi:hypothetical protein
MITTLILAMALGQVQCDPQNPTHCSAPAKKGEPAALTGEVLSPDLSIFLGQKADRTDALIKAETDRLAKEHKIDLALQAATGKADLAVATASAAAQKRVSTYWEGRAARAEQRLSEGPPFYERFWFGATVGVILTTVIVAVVAAESHEIQKL